MVTSTQWQLRQTAAERYEQILVPAILGPSARALVDCLDWRGGEFVADIGCGTGAAARFAAKKIGVNGRVIGVDVNPGMLAVARSLPPVQGARLEWRENSVYDLDLDGGSVDVVLCAQVLQFLSDRPAALREMRRVQKPGGCNALSLWCAIEENPYFHALVEAVEAHVGPETAAGLASAFGLSDPGEIRSLLEEAGYGRVRMVRRRLDLHLPPPEAFVPRHVSATPMAEGFQAAPPGRQAQVIREVGGRLERYRNKRGLRVPFRTYLALAEV